MNTYYQEKKERLQELARSCYHQKGQKEKAKKYYEYYKKILQEKERNTYTELSNERKDIKREYARNRCRYMAEEDKKTKRMSKSYQ